MPDWPPQLDHPASSDLRFIIQQTALRCAKLELYQDGQRRTFRVALVFLWVGNEVARLPQEWFLNTPVLWLAALVLIGLVRGPLKRAPALLKKPLKFAAATSFC